MNYVRGLEQGDIIFITITTPDGEEQKMSGKIGRTEYISYNENIIVQIKFNPKYFNPLTGIKRKY